MGISVTSATATSGGSRLIGGGPGLRVRLADIGVTFGADSTAHRSGGVEALRHLDLDVAAGSFTAIIGPNGCGKSTLLRVVAGLLPATSGTVELGGERGQPGTPPRAGDGRVSLAFQQPRLVPWLSTLDNVGLPLAVGRRTAALNGERRRRAEEMLGRVGLADAAARKPRELSGGMQQRAALARALITDPPLLRLDEPFSALDALTREAFDMELQRLWLERRRTVILVTHSVSEAIGLADRIVVMTARPGRVAQLVDVDLPRPRSIEQVAQRRAAEIEAAVRTTLAQVKPPELASWVAT
jgi:NitT/TauT family transport system ATP-binding protein